MVKKYGPIGTTAWVLVIIGGLNWGLMGLGSLFGSSAWNLVNWIFGSWSGVEAIVYVLVGVSAVLALLAGRGQAEGQMS